MMLRTIQIASALVKTTAATVIKLAITRESSFSLQIHESKSKRTWLEAVSFRRIATVEHTQSALLLSLVRLRLEA